MTIPWQIITGIVVLGASMLPSWMIDLSDAPAETSIRFWTTLIVGVALLGIVRRLSPFRWLLAALLGTGVAVSIYSFSVASVVEPESALITVAQLAGLVMLFTPAANAWFKTRGSGLGATDTAR